MLARAVDMEASIERVIPLADYIHKRISNGSPGHLSTSTSDQGKRYAAKRS
jgi:hypothetical protein